MFRRSLAAFTLLGALAGVALIPSTALAQVGVDLRFFDRSHKDYHTWNGDEDRVYRQYLVDHHRKYREFGRTSRVQQQSYWSWRHESDHR
jgi:hypothetical protein